jgi:hypothetical protein
VGIDGYSPNTVEQIGTDSDCQNGQPVYYAWFEFYPHPSITIDSVPLSPGDVVSAEVQETGKGTFTVTITNVSKGKSFTGSAKVPSAAQASAEWIAEALYSGGVLPLADFSSVYFGSDYTGQSNTCFATISGKTGPIGLAAFNQNLGRNHDGYQQGHGESDAIVAFGWRQLFNRLDESRPVNPISLHRYGSRPASLRGKPLKLRWPSVIDAS